MGLAHKSISRRTNTSTQELVGFLNIAGQAIEEEKKQEVEQLRMCGRPTWIRSRPPRTKTPIMERGREKKMVHIGGDPPMKTVGNNPSRAAKGPTQGDERPIRGAKETHWGVGSGITWRCSHRGDQKRGRGKRALAHDSERR